MTTMTVIVIVTITVTRTVTAIVIVMVISDHTIQHRCYLCGAHVLSPVVL